MVKECTCQEWREWILQITAAQFFCSLQSAGPKYAGPVFEFCPWCGSPLSTEEGAIKVVDWPQEIGDTLHG